MASTKTSSSQSILMATPPPSVNLWLVLSESKRIINAHLRHFLALSVLILLPLSFPPSVLLLITDDQSAASHNSISLLHDGDHKMVDSFQVPYVVVVTVLIRVLYIVAAIVSNLLATGSITYSVFQGYYGRPVKLIPSLKSSLASFFPLLATLISSKFIVLGIFLILGFTAFLLTKLIEMIILPNLDIYLLDLSMIFVMIISIIVILIKLNVDWILGWVIVVLESKVWGLTPLKRSKSLIKGMKRVSLYIIFFFGVTQWALGWISSRAAASTRIENGETRELWSNVFFVLQIVISYAFRTFLRLYYLTAITVMYMYCKALHGEVALEIAQESAREYVSLPFDDNGKVHNNV